MRRNVIKLFLAFGDYLLMVGALSLALTLRYGPADFAGRFEQHIVPFLVVFALWIVTFYVSDLYNINVPFNHRTFLIAMMVNVALAVLSFYTFLDFVDITPRRNLAIVTGCFVVMFYAWRFGFDRSVDRFAWIRSVAIVGSDEHALALAERIGQQRRQGFEVAVIVRDPDSTLPAWVPERGIPVVEDLTALAGFVQSERVHTIVVSDSWYYSLYRDLYQFLPYHVDLYQLTSFWERFDESIPIYAAREIWFLDNFNRGPTKGYHILKRLLDLLTVVVLAPIALLLGIITAVLVRLSGPGPVVFRQTRVGRNEQPFTLYKFRSMVADAEKHGAQWASRRDPRVTPIGRVLRAIRMDELPQLLNVLRGDMSIIGPRPERPEFVSQLSQTIPHYHLRHLVRPGLTGWAQVKFRYGSSAEDAAVKLTYDLYYVKNMSIVLDGKIVLKTILTVVSRQGT